MTDRPAWYGGNKIPSSYLAKFRTEPKQHSELPWELRRFLSDLDESKK